MKCKKLSIFDKYISINNYCSWQKLTETRQSFKNGFHKITYHLTVISNVKQFLKMWMTTTADGVNIRCLSFDFYRHMVFTSSSAIVDNQSIYSFILFNWNHLLDDDYDFLPFVYFFYSKEHHVKWVNSRCYYNRKHRKQCICNVLSHTYTRRLHFTKLN